MTYATIYEWNLDMIFFLHKCGIYEASTNIRELHKVKLRCCLSWPRRREGNHRIQARLSLIFRSRFVECHDDGTDLARPIVEVPNPDSIQYSFRPCVWCKSSTHSRRHRKASSFLSCYLVMIVDGGSTPSLVIIYKFTTYPHRGLSLMGRHTRFH